MFQSYAQNIITFGSLLLTAYVLFRSRTPALLKDELQITRDRCERLEEANKTFSEQLHTKDLEIGDLKSRTNLQAVLDSQSKILEAVTGLGARFIDALNTHAAQDRQMFEHFTSTLSAMEGRLNGAIH